MNEIAIRQAPPVTTLAIAENQTQFSDQQVTMLRHIGLEKAGEADLGVFFHQCKRTGLDPFARQIYMIERWSRDGAKFTIQTGIDGFRLIGRRAADRSKEAISVKPPQWAHSDGSWRDVWIEAWGSPVGARVTIERGGQPFTAVALFDEYKQTKKDGGLTSMWAQRPAGQIAKCAEALAWRMGFPQDLAGIYSDDEMGQASNPAPAPVQSETVNLLRGETVEDLGEIRNWPAEIDAADIPTLQALWSEAPDNYRQTIEARAAQLKEAK